jgi:hypothetical protein
MGMYLGNNTHPDCSFALHQCARFGHDPWAPHEHAMKRIGRYLKGTAEKGLIIKPTGDLTLDCFVDADFAGLFNYEDPRDPVCARSRTGYIMTLGDIPVLWSSKLQTEIALSTMEAEYIAASTAMRALIPLRAILFDITDALGIQFPRASRVSTIWEDNQAAYILATTKPPRLTPRSKSLAVKYHWFREHLSPGSIIMKPLDTKIQKANILTKALTPQKHLEERKLTLGW